MKLTECAGRATGESNGQHINDGRADIVTGQSRNRRRNTDAGIPSDAASTAAGTGAAILP